MDTLRLLRLQPTIEILQEALEGAGIPCKAYIQTAKRTYRMVCPYYGQGKLREDVLYLLYTENPAFPTDRYAYLSVFPMEGMADHLLCSGNSEQILEILFALFARYQDWEEQIEEMTYRNGGLQALCQLGSQLLGNPVCIHDEWLLMSAMSWDMEQLVVREQGDAPAGEVLRQMLGEYIHDKEYLETYSHRTAQIWEGVNKMSDCLYVNLWEEMVYQGRLLVLRHNRPFRREDFMVAQVLAQRAVFMMRRKQLGQHQPLRGMEDIVYDLLQGKLQDSGERNQLMTLLNWKKEDSYLCIHIQNQKRDVQDALGYVLYSELKRSFPNGYLLFADREQYLILNLTQEKTSDTLIRHRLAPLCRDYCLYAGMSSPVADIRDLHLARYQADIALEQAFRLGQEKWIIPFSDYALEHMLQSMNSPLPFRSLISPELLTMMDHDREQHTQYFETFREYILNERDIPKTAQKLIIHRTTLLYRLKKIQALTNVDPEDPWKRLHYMLSLWFLDREANQKPTHEE